MNGKFENGSSIPLNIPWDPDGIFLIDRPSNSDSRWLVILYAVRKPSHDKTNVIFPLFFIGLLAGLAPLISFTGGERISFIITTQLGNILMLTIIEDNTNSSRSGETPRILEFYTLVQICCFHSLLGKQQIKQIKPTIFRDDEHSILDRSSWDFQASFLAS